MRGPQVRTRATPTPSTPLVSTSRSLRRKSGMSSCRVACIWAGGLLRARVTCMAARVITMMTSKAGTSSRISCTRMRTCSAQVKILDVCSPAYSRLAAFSTVMVCPPFTLSLKV
eukprot:scaffold11979_cov108-Isochrysis_galbana.AAC.10